MNLYLAIIFTVMTLSFSAHGKDSCEEQDLIEFVNQSPEAVAAGDKLRWLSLFSDSAMIEDPVGAGVHRAGGSLWNRQKKALSRFYDVFIQGNEISFTIQKDFISGNNLFRRANIHTIIDGEVALDVPAYIHYKMVNERGICRVDSLRAFWSLRGMVPEAVSDLSHLPSMGKFGSRLALKLGPVGLSRYLGGLFGGVKLSKEEALTRLEEALVQGLIEVRQQGPEPSDDLSGLQVSDPELAGDELVFSLSLRDHKDSLRSGIGIARFDPSKNEPIELHIYW